MLLPVHTVPVGEVILTVGGVVSPVVGGTGGGVTVLETVTVSEAGPGLPAPSVTLTATLWLPLATVVVSTLTLAAGPATVCEGRAVLSSVGATVSEPLAPVTAMAKVVVPLTVAPAAGLVNATVRF